MTRVFEWPIAAPGTKPLARPTLKLDPAGFFTVRECAQVAWRPKDEMLVLSDPGTGEVLHAVPAPRGQRRKLRAKMWKLAERIDLADLRAGGGRRERALRSAGL